MTTSTKTRKNASSTTQSETDAATQTFLDAFADAVSGGATSELDVRIAFANIDDTDTRNAASGIAVQNAVTSGVSPATWQPLFESLGQRVTSDPAAVLARQLATIDSVRASLVTSATANHSAATVERANAAIASGSVTSDENTAGRVSVALARLAGRKTANETGTRGRRYDPALVPSGMSAGAVHVDAYLSANTLKMDETVSAATIAGTVAPGSPYTHAAPSPGAIADYLSGKNHDGYAAAGLTGSRGWIGERNGSTVQLRIVSAKTAREHLANRPGKN